MDIVTAETIGKKSKALKHCDKLLSKIDKNGSAKVVLNCTGVEFVVHKDDAIYCRIQSTKYRLLDEIRSYELTTRSQRAIEQPVHRTAPAPLAQHPNPRYSPPNSWRKPKSPSTTAAIAKRSRLALPTNKNKKKRQKKFVKTLDLCLNMFYNRLVNHQ